MEAEAFERLRTNPNELLVVEAAMQKKTPSPLLMVVSCDDEPHTSKPTQKIIGSTSGRRQAPPVRNTRFENTSTFRIICSPLFLPSKLPRPQTRRDQFTMSSSAFRFARHSPAVAAIVTSSWSCSSTSKCDAPAAEEKPTMPYTGMKLDSKGDFHNLFPRRQLWQPKHEYPWWDKDWDGKSPARSGDDEEDRKKMRKLRKEGVTRHIILVRHGQYDETEQDDTKRILTEVGRQQAEYTGKRLKEMLDDANEKFGPCNIKVVRVSNMARAKESKQIHHPACEMVLFSILI